MSTDSISTLREEEGSYVSVGKVIARVRPHRLNIRVYEQSKYTNRMPGMSTRIICWMVLGATFVNNGSSQPSIELLSEFPLPNSTHITDVWGYFDSSSQKEYALITDNEQGLFIVDVTDPSSPSVASHVAGIPGFDVKVWRHFAYTVTGHGAGSGAIVDISHPDSPQVVGSFPSSHNIFISDNGFMYLSGGAGGQVNIYDLNPDPTNPTPVWSQPQLPPLPEGPQSVGGHDVTVVRNRLYDFHGYLGVFIYDVTTPSSPVLLGSIEDRDIVYYHSGWMTEDHQYLFICDELAHFSSPSVADITVWNISDLGNPVKVGQYADVDATAHNLMVMDGFAFTSYYSAGFRVFDISDPAQIFVSAEYDTSPFAGLGWGGGAFGIYPFAPSGNIYISDQTEGLFVFSFSDGTGVSTDPRNSSMPNNFVLHNNYPNPFNPTTTIRFDVPSSSRVSLSVFDMLGQQVAILVDGFVFSGEHTATFDARALPSGAYIYRLETPEGIFTKIMLLLK